MSCQQKVVLLQTPFKRVRWYRCHIRKIQRLIKQQIQVLTKLQVNSVDKEVDFEEVEEEEVDTINKFHPDNTGFFVEDDESVQVVSKDLTGTCLILDTGASKSTVSDASLLYDKKPVTKHMKTYLAAINITHIGTMHFGIYNIFPVYNYTPAGKCNLLSVSQLEDHGFRVCHKNKMFLVYMGTRIFCRFPWVGDLYVSTLVNSPVINSVFAIAEKKELKDWHVILGHPSDIYVNKFLQLFKIKRNEKTGSSVHCEVCQMAKLKRSSHSNPLPTAKSPFSTIHMDVLQLTPVLRGSFKYILVLIDNFLRYNRIYLMQKKIKSKAKIMTFVKELQNHLHVTPAIIHTDHGGEFSFVIFKSFLSENGITLEQGPANSPQTNGLAKRFNQAILVKMRCMLAQSLVPLNYWDKAARFASSLINMLPTLSLNWKSPISILSETDKLIEQVRKIHTLLPFGLKVYVHDQNPKSKISPPSKPLLFLGYEPRSDTMRFPDLLSRRIVVSRDFTPSILSFPYYSPAGMKKLPSTLPNSSCLTDEEFVTINVPTERSSRGSILTNHALPAPSTRHAVLLPLNTPPREDNESSITPPPTSSVPARSPPSLSMPLCFSPSAPPEIPAVIPPHQRLQHTESDRAPRSQSPTVRTPAATKHFQFEWLPKDQLAPKNISSNIDPLNIVEGSRQQNKDLPDISFVNHGEFADINLTESVTINKAMTDIKHLSDWDDVMAAKYNLLDEKNTGILSPPPSADKVIGGMWLLT
jgi:hypothetical protein